MLPTSSGPSGHSSPAPGRSCTRCVANASMIEAGKPSSASSIAGARIRSSGRCPWRSCSASQPSTAPGTWTLRMSPRNGIVVRPSARMRAASDPEPARPTPSSASGGRPGAATMARTSPPRPHRCGPTTAMAAPVATAASAAEPPSASTPMPATAASWSAAATMPRVPRRGPKGASGRLTRRRRSAALRRVPCGRTQLRRRRCRWSR